MAPAEEDVSAEEELHVEEEAEEAAEPKHMHDPGQPTERQLAAALSDIVRQRERGSSQLVRWTVPRPSCFPLLRSWG